MKNRCRSCEAGVHELAPAGSLEYVPGFAEPQEAAALMSTLSGTLDWRQMTLRLYGRRVNQPRLIAWYGDAGVRYTYSGRTLEARGWHPALAALNERLAARTGVAFNSVLCNLYRDGRDGMGWHADDEPELGDEPVIASLSFGGLRRFVLRRRDDHGERVELIPQSGSLIVMAGDLQQYWQHAVPKTTKPVEPRINLTFRWISG